MFSLSSVTVDERRHYSTAMVSLLGSNSLARMDQFLGIARSCLETIGAELWFYNVEKSSYNSGKTSYRPKQVCSSPSTKLINFYGAFRANNNNVTSIEYIQDNLLEYI